MVLPGFPAELRTLKSLIILPTGLLHIFAWNNWINNKFKKCYFILNHLFMQKS